ncbi:Histone-lysine N-methyltransferase SETMAR, partial [Stegodyphus mimosarum]
MSSAGVGNLVFIDSIMDQYKFGTDSSKTRTIDIQEPERSVLPTDVDEAHLRELVEGDQYTTIRELAKELDVSAMSMSRTMHLINLTYKFNGSVSHEIIQAAKNRRVRACTNLLNYQRKDKILGWIVTCDET